MQARMTNPVFVVPEALKALNSVGTSISKGGVPNTTLELVRLRASQINGCSLCVEMHARDLKKAGEKDERLFTVAAWREAPYFTDAERAALALTEAATRLNDRADPVNDEIWNEAARHYDEKAMADLVLNIALINFWNRVNVTIRPGGGSIAQGRLAPESQAEAGCARDRSCASSLMKLWSAWTRIQQMRAARNLIFVFHLMHRRQAAESAGPHDRVVLNKNQRAADGRTRFSLK